MGKVSLKKNLSSMQVLKTLQLLLQGNFTMQELVEKLNQNEKEPIFNNSVVSKYINTCRYCGIDIPKIHNKYIVARMPFGLELSSIEIDLLENLQNIVKEDMTSKSYKIFDKFIQKLNRYSNKKIARVEKDSYQFSAELFENAILERRKIRLMFKSKILMDCTPIKILQNKGKTYFNVIYKNKERMIASERISGIEMLSEKFIPKFNEKSVVFVLKGDLAKKYSPREHEQVSHSTSENSIIISNRGENKEILFSRLLRYDDKCEILHPKEYREEMKQILDEALKNYGVI